MQGPFRIAARFAKRACGHDWPIGGHPGRRKGHAVPAPALQVTGMIEGLWELSCRQSRPRPDGLHPHFSAAYHSRHRVRAGPHLTPFCYYRRRRRPTWEEGNGMVHAENIDSRCSSIQLDDCSRRVHRSLAHRSKFPLSGAGSSHPPRLMAAQ
jgi:hypothetical protein